MMFKKNIFIYFALVLLCFLSSCGKDENDCSKPSVDASLCEGGFLSQGATDSENGSGAMLRINDVINANISHSFLGNCNFPGQGVVIEAENMSPQTITAICDGVVFDTSPATVMFTGVNGSSETLQVSIMDMDGLTHNSQKDVVVDSYVPNHLIQNPVSITSSESSVISGTCDEVGARVTISGPFQPSPIISICSGATFSTPPVKFTSPMGTALLSGTIEDQVGNSSSTSTTITVL